MKSRNPLIQIGVTLALGLGLASTALADHVDGRFAHNRSYPDRGFAVHDLPRDRIMVGRGPDRFYFSRGVWYSWRGGAYIVVAPPLGLFVPVLPPFYTTVWFGGIPYYYANDTYYLWSAQQNSYETVAAPPGAATMPPNAAPPPPPPSDQLFIYPKNGQSKEQQAKDKYDCHSWAMGQTGFDPTANGGNVPPEQYGAKSSDYYRAIGACMTGRGYSVQ